MWNLKLVERFACLEVTLFITSHVCWQVLSPGALISQNSVKSNSLRSASILQKSKQSYTHIQPESRSQDISRPRQKSWKLKIGKSREPKNQLHAMMPLSLNVSHIFTASVQIVQHLSMAHFPNAYRNPDRLTLTSHQSSQLCLSVTQCSVDNVYEM